MKGLHFWFHDDISHGIGGHELLYVVFKLALGFIILLSFSRLLGKKELGQYTPFDFIAVMVLSGILEGVLYSHSTPWYEFIVGIITWIIISKVIDTLPRNKKMRPVLKGQPVFLIKDGNIQFDVLQRENMDLEQLRHALREKSVFSIFDVQAAVLETDGGISVLRKDADQDYPVMVIENGEILNEELTGIPEALVRQELFSHRLELQQVEYAEKTRNEFKYQLKGRGDNAKTNGTAN